VATTDQAASIIQRYDYAAYGALTNAPTSGNAFQYAGSEADDSGLVYMRARYHSPGFGRFVSEDPIREDGGLNGYAYVGGDPVDYNNPLGLAPGNSGERGWSGGAGGTNNPAKHWKDDPTNPEWGWQKNSQTGKKTYKKKPP
jgi:RHS repeat-associated protein